MYHQDNAKQQNDRGTKALPGVLLTSSFNSSRADDVKRAFRFLHTATLFEADDKRCPLLASWPLFDCWTLWVDDLWETTKSGTMSGLVALFIVP